MLDKSPKIFLRIAMPYVDIRLAALSDVATLLDIYNEIVVNTTAIYEDKTHTAEEHQAWYHTKASSGFPLFVAEVSGSVVGYCTYGQFRNWACYRFTVEHSIYVDRKCRGMGIGSQMLQYLIKDARARKYHSMIAGIDAANSVSIHLHQKFGFQTVAELAEVGFKFNRWLDLTLLQLRFQ